MMDSIITALCPDFTVDSNTGEVLNGSYADRVKLAGGGKPTGCCCLAVLTDAANTWTIVVSQVLGPHTLLGSRQVILSPTTTPVEFGSFTSAGNLAFQGQVPAAGHELCGHAALDELGAHPSGSRLTTTVHDPTVRIENLISTEQGVPASELRGLAGSGTHRGESVDRITVSQYPFNGTAPSGLPASERDKLRFAAQYAVANNSWVDILGHSDPKGSSEGKKRISQDRADKAKKEMVNNLGVSDKISKHGLVNVPRFTRVQGLSDTQPPPAPLAATNANWRRIEILIAGFPAGAQVPPPGTPTTVTPITTPSVALTTPADPCEALLIGGAFPPP
jgi:OmpA family